MRLFPTLVKTLVFGVILSANLHAMVYAGQARVKKDYLTGIHQENINNSLVKMESDAEDMMDAVDGKRLKKIQELYIRLSKEMSILNKANQFLPLFFRRSEDLAMQNAWFNLITVEYNEADDMPALANAINQFTGQLVISTHFDLKYKREVAWMDYLGREILLISKDTGQPGNPALLTIRKQNLHKTWSNLKVVVLKQKGGTALAKKVDLVIQKIILTKKSRKLVELANRELELVDSIENFFHIN